MCSIQWVGIAVLCPAAFVMSAGLALAQSSNSSASNAQQGSSAAPACSGNQGGAAADTNQYIGRSRSAVRVLADTNEARTAIAQGNKARATQCVDDALSALGQIQGASIPIYTEFSQVAILGPIQEQQRRSHGGSANNNRPGATGEASRQAENQPGTSAQTGGKAPAVKEVAQEFTAVTLDANMAKDHLQAARTALNNGDTKQADTALAAVQDGVGLVSVEADRPLLRARENLMLARTLAQQGHYDQVSAPLRAAADALDTYRTVNQAHGSDAGNLSQQIRSYASSFSSANHSDAAQKIEQWWDQTRSWTSR
jgi:hypothetical protein